MKANEILSAIRSLAMSQGFYGRLLYAIENADKDERDEYLSYLESQNFNDMVDLVLFIEA